ncbi:MAG: hypothetical protein WCI75_12315 [candidate division NC10 bacterium]
MPSHSGCIHTTGVVGACSGAWKSPAPGAREVFHTNQSSPFQLGLKTAGTEARFDLYYNYRFHTDFDMSARLAGPPMAGPRLFAQTNTFMIRDACGATQHLAR